MKKPDRFERMVKERMAYDEFTAKMVRKCSDLEQALAEKDCLHANQISEVVERLNDDYRAVLIGHENAYRQLMAQAVRLSKALQEVKTIACLIGNDVRLQPCRDMGVIAAKALSDYE